MLSTYRERFNNPLVKETLVYTVTDVVGKAMSFVLLPIVSFYMSPDELGIATNFTVITSLVAILSGLAIVNSLPYFFYEQKKEENSLMVSNLLVLCNMLCIFFVVIIICFHQVVFHYLQLSTLAQFLGVLFVIGSLVSQTSLILLRLENKAHQFAYLQVFQIVFHTVSVILFVVVLREGGIGKIYAEAITFVLVGFVHFFLLFRKGYIHLHLSTVWINKLLKFGIPLLPHSVSFWLKSGLDKVLITTFCGLYYNGLYSMAISIGGIYTMLVQSFFNAYTPYLQKKLVSFDDSNEHKDEKIKIVKQTYLLLLLFAFIGIVTILGSWVVFNYLIDKKYLMAMDFMPLIILANFVYTFYSLAVQYIYKEKKTLIMGVITFSGSLMQILLSYYMVKVCGVMGAIYGLLIGNLIISIGVSLYSNFVYPMPWLGFVKRVAQNDRRAN